MLLKRIVSLVLLLNLVACCACRDDDKLTASTGSEHKVRDGEEVVRVNDGGAPLALRAELTVRFQSDPPIKIGSAQLSMLSAHEPGTGKFGKHMGRPQLAWKLRDVLGLAASLDGVTEVTIRGAGDTQHTFSIAEVHRGDGASVTAKYNKSGLLVVRWIAEDGKRAEVRGASHVQLN